MTDYDGYENDSEPTAVDDRLALMQQFVDLDTARSHMEREMKTLDEKLTRVHSEQRKVRERIGNALGFDDPMAGAKASLMTEVEKMRGVAR